MTTTRPGRNGIGRERCGSMVRAMLLLALAGGGGSLVSCDGAETDGEVARAATHLRIAPAKGVSESGEDLGAAAYEQAASTAQGSKSEAASLIAADAIMARAQHSLMAAMEEWSSVSTETASGQALLMRLESAQKRLEELQSFDAGPARGEITASRNALQGELRSVEASLDGIRGSIAEVESRIADLRSRASQERDRAEDIRSQVTSSSPVQRAELIARANERHRAADLLDRQASEIELELQRIVYARQQGEEALAGVRRRLETLMQRERALEADVASRAQQASATRDTIAQLRTRLGDQITSMAERYNAGIAPALDEAMSGFESAASRARSAQSVAGNPARLSAGGAEHALSSVHRAHAAMLFTMLGFVDQAVARGVTGGTIPEIRFALEAKMREAEEAAKMAGEQAAGSLGSAGASGRAGEILAEVAASLSPAMDADAGQPSEPGSDDAGMGDPGMEDQGMDGGGESDGSGADAPDPMDAP